MPEAAAAERVIAQCQAVGAAEGVALGVSAPARDVPETRQAVREAARAAQLARTLRPGGGALGYDGLGAYKYLLHLRVAYSVGLSVRVDPVPLRIAVSVQALRNGRAGDQQHEGEQQPA